MTLQEWFTDRALFHLVGYLIHDGYRLSELRKAAYGITKRAFRLKLRNTIFQRLIGGNIPASGTIEDYRQLVQDFVDNLDYDTERNKIRSLLLLFNIATLLLNPKSNLRFPFHHSRRRAGISNMFAPSSRTSLISQPGVRSGSKTLSRTRGL
jgi:hypothetical protein